MGYTHYYRRSRVLPKTAFDRAAADCRAAVAALAADREFRVQYESDDPRPPVFSAAEVRFNGAGEEGHETFHVPRVYQPRAWEAAGRERAAFCKTARKPYDAAVCACLIVFRHHVASFRVGSDGDDDEAGWPAARAACQAVLGYGADFRVVEPPRFGRGGLAYRRADRGLDGHPTYDLANGWVMVRYARPRGGRAVTPPTPSRVRVAEALYPDGLDAKTVGWAATLAAGRWVATVEYLRRAFGGIGDDTAAFLRSAAARPGDWGPLRAWADYVQDLDWAAGERMRAMLPGRPARGRRG